MHLFRSTIIALETLGFFALTTISAPSPRYHGPWPPPGTGTGTGTGTGSGSGSVPAPVVSSVAPAATTTSTTTDNSQGSTTDRTTTTNTDTSSNSDSSSGGSGTAGVATIVNKCTFPTYLYVCKQHPATCGSTTTLAANTGAYSEAYAPAADGGHSLKISVTKGSADILQFEYTNEGNGDLSYDLSEVDGNPFGQWGFSLTNTSKTAYCAPPCTSCPAIFTAPTNGVPYTAPLSTTGTGAILCG